MPYRTKATAEEKIRIVQLFLTGKKGLQAAAREAGVDYHTLKAWIAIYENEGAAGFLYTKDNFYTLELKSCAIRDYLNGEGSLYEIWLNHKTCGI